MRSGRALARNRSAAHLVAAILAATGIALLAAHVFPARAGFSHQHRNRAALASRPLPGVSDLGKGTEGRPSDAVIPLPNEPGGENGGVPSQAGLTTPQPPVFFASKVADDQAVASVEVFDTGTPSPVPLLARTVTAKPGWASLPEDSTSHRFRGDAVLTSGRVALVLRQGGPGAELYGRGAGGPTLRAVLAPTGDDKAWRLGRVAAGEISPSVSALDATFRADDGQEAVVRFEIQAGQGFVSAAAMGSVDCLRVEAPCRFAVLPDLFADDIVIDARDLPSPHAGLPSENFLLHMIDGGEAIVLAVWEQRDREVGVALAGRDRQRRIEASAIPFRAGGRAYVALLEGPGIWHSHEVTREDEDQVVRLKWRAPFVAQWRVDWRQDNGLTDSWEMFIERSDGSYAKLDWFGQSDADGTPEWLKSGLNRWTPTLGGFTHPCWLDREGRGCLRPIPGRFQGPALAYPLARAAETPLAAFTFVDMMRATLGIGPCEYLLDLEGQQRQFKGMPTCVARQKLNAIYASKQQVERRDEVEQCLEQVLAFVLHIRARIEAYSAFGRQTLAYLEQQKQALPELTGTLEEMEALARGIDALVDRRQLQIHTRERAVALVEQFRSTLLGYTGNDAPEQCHKIINALGEIGEAQDALVGECRREVKILRQKSALAMAADPRFAPVAREVRRQTWAVLRSPTSFEAPRN